MEDQNNNNLNPEENQENTAPQVPEVNETPSVEVSESESTPEPVIPTSSLNDNLVNLNHIASAVDEAKTEIRKYIVGQEDLVEQVLISLFAYGHVLLEGVPGIAKTLTAKVFAQTLGVDFSRIQFTPDLMPSDVLGTSVYNMKTSEFEFKKGPIFSNVVLIDEINRAPAKTQAALFEVMEERQITMDGQQYDLGFPFLIIATQNPVEQEGTYRLPEAQLDRFIFRIKLDYPTLEEETAILTMYKNNVKSPDVSDVKKVFTPQKIKEIQDTIEQIRVSDGLVKYIAEIVNQSRNNPRIYLGASPRASLSILKASKTVAAMRGRDFVTPDDIQYVATPVLNHRIILSPDTEMEGIQSEDVISDMIAKVEVPR